ncbi:MAG: F-type H+-transporting ATPase subunit epsilon [Crocinitomix sp.]|jgi:F-type H+-transporting ATPase subunit epsilon
MLLEVITPDETLFKGNISHVVLPGIDGSFGILNGHAPMISALAKGSVKVDQIVTENESEELGGKYNEEFKGKESFEFEINGGIIEVKDNSVIVLAE